MIGDPKNPVSAEDVKAVVRAYADAHFPGWECASATIRVGEIMNATEECLLILPARSSSPPPPTA